MVSEAKNIFESMSCIVVPLMHSNNSSLASGHTSKRTASVRPILYNWNDPTKRSSCLEASENCHS